jgi:hypothetical protein
MGVFWIESKSSKSTAPGTELMKVPLRINGDRESNCWIHGQHTPAAAYARAQLRLHRQPPLNEPPQPRRA